MLFKKYIIIIKIMGCCSTKISEEKSIFNFFINLNKTNKFEFTIENYDNNYEDILKKSNNNFKKLEKKQEIRIKFIKLINKYIKNIKKNENEDNYSNKSLYIIIILTILIDNYLNQANYEEKKNNDLNEALLKIASEIYFYNLKNLQKYKIILYYLGKLFVIIFNIPNPISNFLNINKYIMCLNDITSNSVLSDNEFILFIKVHLISLGNLFEKICEKNKNTLKILTDENEKILINYYVQILVYFKDFIINNNEIIKINNKIINSENYLNEYNFNTFSNGNLLTEENNNIKNLKIDIEKLNEFDKILNSFFYFLILSIKDTNKGKKLIKTFDEEFNLKINNIKLNEIILLILLNKIKNQINEPLISCLIDILKEKINDEIYNNILLEFLIFIFDYNILKEYRIELLSDILINNLDKENKIIEKIVKFIKTKDNNEYYFIIKLILKLSQNFKIIDYDKKINLLQKINRNLLKIDKSHIKLNDFDKDDFFNIINNFNIYNNNIKEENVKLTNNSEYNKNKNIVINYFEFFQVFINFTMSHINMQKIYDKIKNKNIILLNIQKYIFQYINFSKDNNYINIYIEDIIAYFKLFINLINEYKFDLNLNFNSYKLLENIFKTYHQNENDLNLFNTFYIYNTILFILCLYKKINNLQITLISEHNNIINSISKLNLNISEHFKKNIPLNEYLDNKNNYFDLINKYKNSIIEYFNNNYNDKNIELNKEIIIKINNFIYNEIFNYQSNINNYFETQNENIENIINPESINFNIENNNDTNTLENGINLKSYLNNYEEKSIIIDNYFNKSNNMLQPENNDNTNPLDNIINNNNNDDNIINLIKDNKNSFLPENLGINL